MLLLLRASAPLRALSVKVLPFLLYGVETRVQLLPSQCSAPVALALVTYRIRPRASACSLRIRLQDSVLLAPCSMCPVKCVRVPCRSIPHRSLARHQLGLFGQLLLPSIQLRQGPGAEMAFGDLPLVVLL